MVNSMLIDLKSQVIEKNYLNLLRSNFWPRIEV